MSRITKVNFQNWNHFRWPHLIDIKYWIHFHFFFHPNFSPAFHSFSECLLFLTLPCEISISIWWKNIWRDIQCSHLKGNDDLYNLSPFWGLIYYLEVRKKKWKKMKKEKFANRNNENRSEKNVSPKFRWVDVRNTICTFFYFIHVKQTRMYMAGWLASLLVDWLSSGYVDQRVNPFKAMDNWQIVIDKFYN